MLRYAAILALMPMVCLAQNIGLRLDKGTPFYLELSVKAPSDTGWLSFTQRELQTRCERRLREVGIRYTGDLRDESLWINVGVGTFSFSVIARFERPVWLEIAGESYGISATTWSVDSYGAWNGENPVEILDALERTMDAFINDFLDQNREDVPGIAPHIPR